MLIDFKLKKLSGHSSSGKVGKIYKKANDSIKAGEKLMDIESNKGNVTVFSDVTGIIKSIEINVGDTVKKGDLLAKIEGEQANQENSKTAKQGAKSSSGFNYMGSLMKPKKEDIDVDITIIGAGPGGYVAAIQAAKSGAKVALVEKENIGGTCLNRGCIPTKAFVRSAEVFKDLKESENYGLTAENISVDINKVVARKNEIVKQLVGGIEYLIEKNNIQLFMGEGKILDQNTVFTKHGNKETTIHTKNIIIATGSVSSLIPLKGVESPNILTSKELLDIKTMPKKLVIVGGGVIGMEFAFIFRNFGVDVTVVEFLDNILATLDDDISGEITSIAEEKGIKIYTSSKVEEIIDTEDKQSVVVFSKGDKKHYITADKILLAVGRRPNISGFDSKKLGIELNDRGRGIKVNEKMQTNIPNIYAIGDVTNIIQLAHVASHQGIVAVENILGKDEKMNYDVIPSAIFTDPEIAVVGISEKEAKKQNIDIVVGTFPFAANGKALTLGEARGFVKIIKEKSTDKILGAAIIGPHATDLIHELAIAVKNGLKDTDIIKTIHAHPTTSESIHEAALASTKFGAIHFAE